MIVLLSGERLGPSGERLGLMFRTLASLVAPAWAGARPRPIRSTIRLISISISSSFGCSWGSWASTLSFARRALGVQLRRPRARFASLVASSTASSTR
jgi:hypothetical protein